MAEMAQASPYLSGWRLGVVIAALFSASFLIALDASILNVAIPKISTDFRALDDVLWYASAYLLTITAFQPVYGFLYKYFENTMVYRISILIFEVGSVICAAATNSPMFIVGRAIAGLGGAGLLQGALSIIAQVVPLEKRALYMGVVVSVFAITACLGPPLGGVFTEHVSWRWCFWINIPIGVAVIVLLPLFLRIQKSPNEYRDLPIRQKLQRFDPLGCITFLGAVCCLLLALQWGGQTKPWSSATVIGLLVGSAVLFCVFFVIQSSLGNFALIPLHVLSGRSIWTGAMVLYALGSFTYLNSFFLPFYFQAAHGATPVHSGVDLIPFLFPQIVAMALIGLCVKRWGYYVPYMVAGEIVAIIGQALLTQLDLHTPTVKWATYMVLAGLGSGVAINLPYTAVQVTLPEQDIPTGNAIAVLFFQLGGAIAISIGQAVSINAIIELLREQLPHLSKEAVLRAGAADLLQLVSSQEELVILQKIWSIAISRTMILSTGLLALSVPFTLGMDWLNAKKVAAAKEEALLHKAEGHFSSTDELTAHDVYVMDEEKAVAGR